MFEDNNAHAHCKIDHIKKRKKEIYYNPTDINSNNFFLDLFHEVGHFPRIYEIGKIGNEKVAWLNSIKIATALKNQYNFCSLAGFQGYNDIYNYIDKPLSTYSTEPCKEKQF